MYKKCVNICVTMGMLFFCLVIGHSSIPARCQAGKFSRYLKIEGLKEIVSVRFPVETMLQFYEIEEEKESQLPDNELAEYCKKLLKDNILQEGNLELTSFEIVDLDQNGQKDIIIMAAKPGYSYIDAPGCIYVYFNDESPYCFRDDDYDNRKISTYNIGFYDKCQVGDIDNDGNLELMISIDNGGNGGAGGSEYIILKHKDNTFEEMELSGDMGEKHRWGLTVLTYMGDQENLYRAYCPYMHDEVEFSSDNEYPFKSRYAGRGAGGNCRGFHNYRCVEYEGKNALQCSEYLYGEGGIAHAVGSAEFILVWDEEESCNVAKWWVEAW